MTLGVFLVLAYAGDNNAFTADLPGGQNAVLQGAQVAGEEALTFEIVNSLSIQNPDPVLEPSFTTSKKIHDIPYLLRRLLLLLGGRHGLWRIDYVTEVNAARIRDEKGAYKRRVCNLAVTNANFRPHTHGSEKVVGVGRKE